MKKELNVLLLTRYFPPEIGTAANLFYDLAKGLSENGHKVTVVTNFPWYNLNSLPERYKGKIFMKEYMHGFEVVRLTIPIFGPQAIKLALGHLTVPFTSFLSGLLVKKPDIIFAYSPPLFMGVTGWLLKLFKKTPFVLGIQDLHPQCYIDQGVLKNKTLIRFLEMLEKFGYNKSSLITVHSDGNKEHIAKIKGINEEKINIIPNWIDTDDMCPISRDNEFSKKHDLVKKFIVGYAGTLGMSQGCMNIIDAAYFLRGHDNVKFIIVGDGLEKKNMVDKVIELKLKNVEFLGMQSKDIYPYVVASSDVQLVTLNSKVLTPVVPSKILSIMAAARPVLASMPLNGDAPKLIEEAKCGICVGPDEPEKIAKEIMHLSENKDICNEYGSNGREYVLNNMSLNKVINCVEDAFVNLIKQKGDYYECG